MATPSPLRTVRDLLRLAVSRFTAARLSFGHGSANAYDEAAYLVLHTLNLPLDTLDEQIRFNNAQIAALHAAKAGETAQVNSRLAAQARARSSSSNSANCSSV